MVRLNVESSFASSPVTLRLMVTCLMDRSQSSLGLTAHLSVEWDVGSLLPAFLEFFSGTKAPLGEQWLLMEFLLTGGLWRGEQESF